MSCSCNDNENLVWVGSGLKFAVTMTCEGFDMSTDDWSVTVTRGGKSVVFNSQNAVYDDQEDQWYICIDTSDIGAGTVYIVFEADVPDDDFEGGIRKEIQKYRLMNIKSL